MPEGTDHSPRRIYLTEGSNLVGVDPQTGQVKATASGSAVNGAAGVYVVRNGVALGLDQGGGGDAWGYDLAVQRVTLAAPGLPWPHYFVDLSGVGGSADPASNLVIIAACRQLAPAPPTRRPRRPRRPRPHRRPHRRPGGRRHILASPGPFHRSGIVRPCHAGPRRQHLRPSRIPGDRPGLPAARAGRPQFVALLCSTYPAMP